MSISLVDKITNKLDDVTQCSVNHLVAEAVFFLFKVGEALIEPATRLYIYQGVCLEKYSNGTYCDHLGSFPDRQNEVQKLSADYLFYYKLILNLPAVLLGLFCGAWSDKVGRKVPAMLSAFGTIIAVIFYMMSMLSDDTTGKPMLYLVFVGASIRGGFGKSAVMTMALHSYVSDISTTDTRTKRLGRLVSMSFFGCFVGSLLVGALLDVAGFDVIFCCVVLVNSVCVIITIFFMRESVPPIRSHSGLFGVVDPSDPDKPENVDSSVFRKMKIPFRWKHVRESIDVLIKSRQNRVQLQVLLLFGVILFHQACKSGEVDITLLFVEKSPLNWSKSMYGYLLATDYACLGIASAIILPLLIRYVDLRDVVLIMIGLSFKILRIMILAFSDRTWTVYMSVILGCPSAFIISGVKSLISKLVDEDEIGKTFSLLSCGETLSNLVGSLVFTSLYASTVQVFPGTTFIVDAALSFVVLVAVVLLAWDTQNITDRPGSVRGSRASLLHLSSDDVQSVVGYGTTTVSLTTCEGIQIAVTPTTPDSVKSVKGINMHGGKAEVKTHGETTGISEISRRTSDDELINK